MAARSVELAEAVASYIASQQYPFSFNVRRRMIVQSDLATTATTNVYVYPMYEQGKQLPVDTRHDFGRQYTIIVHITNFVDDLDTQAEVDDSLELAEVLEESLENVSQAGFAMLGFGAEQSASFLEIDSLHNRNFYHVTIPLVYVTVD